MLNDENEKLEKEEETRMKLFDNNQIPGKKAIGLIIMFFVLVVILFALKIAGILPRWAVGVISLVLIALVVGFLLRTKKAK